MNSLPDAVLDRDAFFAAAPAPLTEDVRVPWGSGLVRVRQVTAGERDRWEAGVYGKDKGQIRASLVVASCVDAGGTPLFTPADLPRLASLPAYAIEPIVDAASRLNAIRPEDVDALEKKSEADLSEDSSSVSP